MKKRISLVMAMTMAGGLLTCGNVPVLADDKVSFTIFNSKNEIQEQLEEKVAEYGEANNVEIEVYYSNDTVSAHLATKYAGNDPYTLMMVDAKDVYSLGDEYAIDLSDGEWTDYTDYAITMDGQVKGFPLCIEARGLLYNADAIEAIIGRDFVPEEYATLDAFTALLDELVEGGMEAPTAVQKEDWSLGAHYIQEVYEQRENPDEFIDQLYAGEVKLMEDKRFNSLMDTLDVLLKYNYAKDNAATAEREVTQQKLASGEIAFVFDGCWAWGDVQDFEPTENLGQMPLPQNTDDDANMKMVGGGSKYFMIDASENTSDEQRQAAKDFLNWLAMDEEGQKFLVEDCILVSPFSNNELVAANPFGQSIKEYADNGALFDNYCYDPDDHISVVGASMQKYLAGVIDREGLASEMETYWSTVTPVEH